MSGGNGDMSRDVYGEREDEALPESKGRARAAHRRDNVKWLMGLPFSTAAPPARYGEIGYLAATLGVAAATGLLQLMLPLLSTASIYLVYLLVVVAVSVGWGLKHGVYASVLGFLAGNFF